MAYQGNNVDDLEAGNYVAEEDSFSNYMTLHRATVHGKWEEAKTFLEYNNLAIQAPISFRKNTTLHDAAKAGHKDFMEKAVEMMGDNNEVVGVVKNRDGLTALHIAARFGNKEAGEILVGKNRNLLYEKCKRGLLPIHYAACNTLRKPEVFSYFLSVTKNDEDPEVDPYAGPTGATILVNLIKSKFYVMAWKLAHEYPDLARHRTLNNETSPLEAMVKYDYPIFKPKQVAMLNLKLEAVMVVKCLCDKLKILNETQVASLAKEAIIQAAYLDIEEVVKNIVEACPNTAYYKDKNGRNILHIAIENHSTNVFKYVRGNSMLMHDLVDERDKNGNNIVHLAGKLTPPHKLNVNAALQMQQDLQWVKEVQKIAPAYFSSLRNKDEKTAKMVFTDEHKELRKEGEKWMKDTATACSVVAALIVTVMFAASITVPGGNSDGVLTQGFNGTIVAMGSNNNNVVPNMINGTIKGPIDETPGPPDEGLPVFRRRRAFKIFYVNNGISLFCSVASLMVFLSIITSHYREEDFLIVLPLNLIVGLLALVFSVFFMIASSIGTIYLVIGLVISPRRVILIVLGLTFCLIVLLLYQFPLVLDFARSTLIRPLNLKKLGATAHKFF
nr:ankyrin repeat-containing protein NPR4-like isoform X3 [Ipomoea batatas]GMD91540.1 ankyrin repeat-containing protein NPR4-like isoform X3 [Ipomoea batatas]